MTSIHSFPGRWLLGATIAALSAIASAAVTLTIIPAAPRYLEPVVLRLTPADFSGENIYGAQVSMEGTSILVQYQSLPELGQYYYDVMLGRLPSGSYSVRVPTNAGTVTTQFTVSPPERSIAHPGTVPAVNYSDLWYSPAEPGWGLSIAQGPTNLVFAMWYVYDASGNPVWYSLQPGSWTATNVYSSYSGPIYKTRGPTFTGTFDPALVSHVQAGTGTLQFRDSSTLLFRYTLDGVTTIKNLTRQRVED
jgi:hypothetical protein